MTKARTLADMISDGVIGTTELADDVITPVKLDETGSYIVAGLTANGNTVINERLDVNKQGEAFRLRTGDAATQNYISIGRTGEDARITMSGGANNAIQTSAAGDLVIGANNNLLMGRIGSPYINLNSTGVVLNELGGADKDFRVESDNSTHALFVNAGDDKVSINTGSTHGTLTIEHNLNNSSDWWTNAKGVLYLANTNASGQTAIKLNNATDTRASLVFNTSGTGRFQLFDRTSTQERLGSNTSETVINEDSANVDFRVESDNATHMLFVDAGADKVLVNTNLTSTQDVEPSVPAPMSVKNGLFLFRDMSLSGNDRNLLNLDTNGGWATAGNIGTYTNIRWSNGASSTMGQFGLTYGSSTTVTGATSEFAIQGLFNTNYGNSGVVAAFGSNQSSRFMGGITVNENGNNQDFRVESDSNANMFVVNAADSTVGIGTIPSTNYRTLTVVNALDTDNSQIHIHGSNSGLYIGDSYTGGFGNNGAIARALVAGYHISSSLVGDLCIGAETAAGIRFGTQASGNGLTNRMYISQHGNVSIAGSLSKGSGSFKIDHPLPEKTETHHLIHSFVESPQADNIYRGKVDLVAGQAAVNIDMVAGMTEGTFATLNREIQCFTSNETGWTAVRGSVSGNILTIEAQDNTCTDTVSWLVVGERQDQHMYDTDWTDDNGKVIVEPLKENA